MEQVLTKGFQRSKIHPHKFALWVALASIVMLFTALTSAYIVRKAAGNWLEFPMPVIFYWNTLVIFCSSISMYAAYRAYKQSKATAYRWLLLLTLLLGLWFLVLQYQGWIALKESGIPLRTNPSGDFIYVISGIHAAHIIGGVAALLLTTVMAWVRPFKQNEGRQLRLELTQTYWHFVDFLWLYLIGFWMIQG